MIGRYRVCYKMFRKPEGNRDEEVADGFTTVRAMSKDHAEGIGKVKLAQMVDKMFPSNWFEVYLVKRMADK